MRKTRRFAAGGASRARAPHSSARWRPASCSRCRVPRRARFSHSRRAAPEAPPPRRATRARAHRPRFFAGARGRASHTARGACRAGAPRPRCRCARSSRCTRGEKPSGCPRRRASARGFSRRAARAPPWQDRCGIGAFCLSPFTKSCFLSLFYPQSFVSYKKIRKFRKNTCNFLHSLLKYHSARWIFCPPARIPTGGGVWFAEY